MSYATEFECNTSASAVNLVEYKLPLKDRSLSKVAAAVNEANEWHLRNRVQFGNKSVCPRVAQRSVMPTLGEKRLNLLCFQGGQGARGDRDGT